MDFPDAPDILEILVVEIAGQDRFPVGNLVLLGMVAMGIVPEEVLNARRAGQGRVEIRQRTFEHTGKHRLHFTQAFTGFRRDGKIGDALRLELI